MAVRGWSSHGCTVVLTSFTSASDSAFAIVRDFEINQSRASVDVTGLVDTTATKSVPSGVVTTRVSVSFVWDPLGASTKNPIVSGATYEQLQITFSDSGGAGTSTATITLSAATNKGAYVESCDIDAQPDGTYEGKAELVVSGALLTFAFTA